jgi:hypothetical protein
MAGYLSPANRWEVALSQIGKSGKDRDMESYKVILDGGSITYEPSIYGCDYCGFTDNNKGYFTLVNGSLFCSLHIGEAVK